MTTTAQTLIAVETDLSRLRADVLRTLLALADTHDLAMPENIDIPDYTDRGGYRMVVLHVDRNAVHDFMRWAEVLGLPVQESTDFDLGSDRPWRALKAEKHVGNPFTGWSLARVSCYLDLPVDLAA
jgi:hypothetical protein